MAEIFLTALRLGGTSFGGPVAHLAYFRRECVVKRRWLDEEHYADLVALCQFLPGPASSQTIFGLGYLQRGLAGGAAASLGFTLPSALLMIGFAYGVAALGGVGSAGWMQGLKVAAVAVVAQAVWAMGRSLCTDWPRRGLALGAAALVLWLPQAWSQMAVIAAGAVLGWVTMKSAPGGGTVGPAGSGPRTPDPADPVVPPPFSGTLCLVLFFALLLALPVLALMTANPWLGIFDRFYRAGALVFGGGHVILPLLEREVVAPGWLTHDQFLAGYGAAQAVPGPLFTLSGYLGTVMTRGPGGGLGAGWLGGAWAVLAIFLPALLLVAGVLPFWQTLRHQPGAQAALRGANVAVVGVLLAAFYDPVCTAGLTGGRAVALAAAGFIALQSGRVPAWAVVAAAAALGGWLL
ncbi:MAG: chromate efflux transporter [Opitutae bacterium]|nr:chromate efflux transporter [Opitutae bacterium]